MEKKILKGTLHYFQVFIFDVVCVAQQIINNLYIFFIIYLEEDFF